MGDDLTVLAREHGVRLEAAIQALIEAVQSGDAERVRVAGEGLAEWCGEAYRLGFEHGRLDPPPVSPLH